MAFELETHDFKIVENFFSANMFQIPAMAVLNLKFPGKVFVDNRENPEIALVWALSRWSYISCKEILPKHKSFISDVFQKFIRPLVIDAGENYFEIYSDNSLGWDNLLKESLDKYIIEKHYENTFTLNIEKFRQLNFTLDFPNDIEICENTYPIMPEHYFKYISSRSKQVFGMSIQRDVEVISQCINNGFIHNNKYFIDLDTFAGGERNKGYGTFITFSMINNQLKKGYSPLWETTVNNLPSQKVACKLGFEKVEEYPVFSIRNFI